MLTDHGVLEAICERTRVPAASAGRAQHAAERLARDTSVRVGVDRAFEELTAGSTARGLELLAGLGLEEHWGDDAPPLYLLVALHQVPLAEARHAGLGIEAAVTGDTLADVGLWARHFEAFGAPGVTLEILEWLQHALRGGLYRVGAHQFEHGPFTGEALGFRHRVTGQILCAKGERPWDGQTTWSGLRLDAHGDPTPECVELAPREWECVVARGTPMLEMHTPADVRFSSANALRSTREAHDFFHRHFPGAPPAGVWGFGWFFDPQVLELLPRHRGIRWFQEISHLFPYGVPEERTIRRFFGPAATRASCTSMPRESMNMLQLRLAEHFSRPGATLVGRGAFVLFDELEPLWSR